MRQLRLIIVSALMLWSITLNVSGASPQFEPVENAGAFGQVTNIGAIVSSFLPLKDMKNCALVSKGWSRGTKIELQLLKAWKDGGGLIVTVFGNPTNEDILSYYRLKGVDAISRNMSADQLKDLLLSFVYIEDADLRDQLSTTIKGYTQQQRHLSEKEIHMLISLVPNATIFELSKCLSKDLMVYGCYPGKPLELTDENLANVNRRHSSIPRRISAHSNPGKYVTYRSFDLRGCICPGMPEQ